MQNNLFVRKMLSQSGIKAEELPPSIDIKKLERRVKSQKKAGSTGWPGPSTDGGNDDGE